MRPEHLSLLRTPSRPSVHPDQPWAVVALERPDLDADAYRSRLWRIHLEGGPALALTAGERDDNPVISPDGRWIAFTRTVEGKAQVALLDTRGGEPRVLTSHPLGVAGRPEFSPDSARLAYRAPVPEPGRYGTADGVGPDAEPARRITHLTYRLDGAGFTLDKPNHVYVLDLPHAATPSGGEAAAVRPVRLTEGERGYRFFAWMPDSSGLVALRDRLDALGADLVRLDLPERVGPPEADDADDQAQETGDAVAPVPAVELDLGVGRFAEAIAFDPTPPAGEPDGEGGFAVVLLINDFGPRDVDFVGVNAGLYRGVLTADGVRGEERLTDPEVEDLQGSGIFAVRADGAVIAARVRRGRTEVVEVDRSGAIGVLHPGSVIGADLRADGAVVASVVLPDSPGEVVLIEAATLDAAPDGVSVLTDFAAGLRGELGAGGVRPSVVVPATAPDGYPVHGWLALPDPGEYGDGPYPVLLAIHGGPYADYQDVFFDEVQVYAGAGYAVVYGNPRGSAGYGSAHGRALRGRFGQIDSEDVLALLDAALAADSRLDGSRVGVMGGSYGGYLTAWLTTQPVASRFSGAIVERGFLDPVSFVGSSDIGWNFPDRYLGSDPEAVAAQSPMARLDAVTTPTLVIHSEHDWRCPVEQGQRWYVGLKRNGVETELLLFPGEGHELSRSGRPKHRLQRFEAILDWWEELLG